MGPSRPTPIICPRVRTLHASESLAVQWPRISTTPRLGDTQRHVRGLSSTLDAQVIPRSYVSTIWIGILSPCPTQLGRIQDQTKDVQCDNLAGLGMSSNHPLELSNLSGVNVECCCQQGLGEITPTRFCSGTVRLGVARVIRSELEKNGEPQSR